jgi:hypothetical protein
VTMTQTFPGVTQAVMDYIRDGNSEDYTLEQDPDGQTGTVTGQSFLGKVAIRFQHNAARSELTLTILQKPMLLPASLIWSGFNDEVHRALRELAAASTTQKALKP